MRTVGTLAALCVLCAFVSAYTGSAQARTIAPEPTEPIYEAQTVHGEKGKIMHIARSYAGAAYTPYTFNCSDYTRVVFGKATGLWMIDNAPKQRYYGYHPRSLRRSDLVFFDENGPGGKKVTHVAIYAGSGYVWQNSSYWGKVVKTYMPYIKGFRPEYTRRIR